MTPDQASAYLEGLEILGMRFGTDRMHRLLAELGDPHGYDASVHVVGSNGKTSTTLLTAALLEAHGHRTGSYVSPHIDGWAERIRVGGVPITPETLAAGVARVRDAADRIAAGDDRVTQFEAITAACFVAHRDAGVSVGVIEAGLGGRFDATNVLGGGTVSVLTGLDLEHTALLGETLAEIAAEKLAIAPEGSDRWIIGAVSEEAGAAIAQVMDRHDLSGWWFGSEFWFEPGHDEILIRCLDEHYPDVRLWTTAPAARANATLAVAVARRLHGRALDADVVRVVLAGTRVPGRFDRHSTTPPVIVDGAHNPAGMAALVPALPQDGRGVAVMSVLDDKNIQQMLRIMAPRCRRIVATRSAHQRAIPAADLAAAAIAEGLDATPVDEPASALALARSMAGPDGWVVVCGSLYLVRDLHEDIARPAAPPEDETPVAR